MVEKILGNMLATIGTMVSRKNAGKKQNPSGSTHLTDSERTRRNASFADFAWVKVNSSSSASVIGPPVNSDLEIVRIAWPRFGYFFTV